MYSILMDTVTPIQFFELSVEINHRYKKKIDINQARMASNICEQIEMANEDTFCIKFEYLPSTADKAHRVLHNSKIPLHIRDIARQINHLLVKAGFLAKIQIRTLQQQLVSDSRFEPVGRSGMWILSEWQDIRRDSIVELMKEFFHLKQGSAIPADVFEYVYKKRSDVSKHSVYAYLQTEIFIRVSENSYELAEWGGKPQKSAKRFSKSEVQERIISGIKTIFSTRDTNTLPLSDLVRELVKITNIPPPTIYMNVVHSSLLEFERIPTHSRAKKATYIGEQYAIQTNTTTKKTITEIVQREIAKYLLSQPKGKALLSDIADHVIKITKCKKLTFYLYLSRMENIIKDYDDRKKVYCHIVIDSIEGLLSFPQVEQIDNDILKEDLYRAVKNLNIDNVDLGLFQLGKIFENELKDFLLEAQKKRVFVVSSKDLERLVSMIDCVERNGIIKTKHHLTLLREHRNERAHGKIPNKVEREKLMQHAPFLADMYIQYIAIFSKKRGEL